MVALNSAALTACGITADSGDIEGGVVERLAGRPTGVLREKAIELLKPLTDHEALGAG